MIPTLPNRLTALRRLAPRVRSRRGHSTDTKPTTNKSGGDGGPGSTDRTITSPEQAIPVPNTIATIPLWQRLGPLTRLATAYARAQRRRPYVTQLCGSVVIYLCADTSAQRMSGKEYDVTRTGRALVIGSLSSIPSYEWFLFLARNFNYSSHLLSLATKIIVNQAFFTPVFNSYFFGMQSLLAGDSLDQVIDRIRRTVPVSVVNSLKLWPAVTAFSFTFIPLEYRSVFAGVIAVGWQTYLSYLNRLAEVAAEKPAPFAVAETAASVA